MEAVRAEADACGVAVGLEVKGKGLRAAGAQGLQPAAWRGARLRGNRDRSTLSMLFTWGWAPTLRLFRQLTFRLLQPLEHCRG